MTSFDGTQADTLQVRREDDVVMVRRRVRDRARDIGLDLVTQTKIVTAASELARNLLVYGGGGEARLEVLQEGIRRGLRVTFEDHGPGIPDIPQAMRDGYTSGGGMGLGLGGAKRLVNDFSLVSKVGDGTKVTITRWK